MKSFPASKQKCPLSNHDQICQYRCTIQRAQTKRGIDENEKLAAGLDHQNNKQALEDFMRTSGN